MRKVEQAIKEEIEAIIAKVGPELERMKVLEELMDTLKASKNGSKKGTYKKRTRKENRPGLGELPSNGAVGSKEEHEAVVMFLEKHPDATRKEIEGVTGITGTMSTILAELVKLNKIEQTNLPAQRGTKWNIAKEMRIHVGEGVIK